jgi:hypothetical protein
MDFHDTGLVFLKTITTFQFWSKSDKDDDDNNNNKHLIKTYTHISDLPRLWKLPGHSQKSNIQLWQRHQHR